MTRAMLIALFSSLSLAPSARADAPPAQAFDACSGKTLAADCQVNSLDRQLEGLCVIEGQDHLFCLPYELSLPPQGYLN